MTNDSKTAVGRSHPKCTRPDRHVCQKSSGRTCYERDCAAAAGTLWGPYWCPEHDAARLDRISASLEDIAASFGVDPE